VLCVCVCVCVCVCKLSVVVICLAITYGVRSNICRDHVVFTKLGYIYLPLMLLCFCAVGSLEKHILSKHIQLLSSNVSSIFSV